MIRPGAAVAVAAAAALASSAAQTPSQPIRTGIDVVFVDVSVRDGGRTVPGLRAEDFILTDSGVRQKVESVEATAVPIDLTLVVDVSGSPSGSWTPPARPAAAAERIQREVAEVRQLLRPGDRLRLLAIDTHVQQLVAMGSASEGAAPRPIEVDGMSALYDTIAAALLQPVEPARRHVVVARTKGIDTISSIDAAAVRAIAERSDALFHLVVMEEAGDQAEALSSFQCSFMGLCYPTRAFWVPFQRRLVGFRFTNHALMNDGEAVAAGAASTGGALHKTQALAVPTLTGTFRRAFEDFRSSYLLRYTPQGVQAGGWHAIDVRLAGGRDYRVSARKGYLVEQPAPPPAPAAVPDVPKTLAELTAAYDRGAYRPVIDGVRATSDPARLLREFSEAGNAWPAAPRKEAAFALELVEPSLFSPREATRDAAHELLTRFGRLIRHPIEPDGFERYWHFAALTLLEGSLYARVTEAFAARALERFPDEPRFLLSRANAIDQRWATRRDEGVTDTKGRPTAAHEEAVRAAYTSAARFPDTAAEAHIRLAWFLHRIDRHDQALAHLNDARPQNTAETPLKYLRQLFLGHVLSALGRGEEALAAFRAAEAIVPTAQSARVAQMNAQLMIGDRAGAEAIAEQIQTETRGALDPWWMYWQGQYRLHPAAMARVRELSR